MGSGPRALHAPGVHGGSEEELQCGTHAFPEHSSTPGSRGPFLSCSDAEQGEEGGREGGRNFQKLGAGQGCPLRLFLQCGLCHKVFMADRDPQSPGAAGWGHFCTGFSSEKSLALPSTFYLGGGGGGGWPRAVFNRTNFNTGMSSKVSLPEPLGARRTQGHP